MKVPKRLLLLVSFAALVSSAAAADGVAEVPGDTSSAADARRRQTATESVLDNPSIFLRGMKDAWVRGDLYAVGVFFVISLMAALRLGGKWAHDALPDDHPLDKFLWFWFDTKPGRILKLALTGAAAGVASAWSVGVPITPDLVNPILGVTFSSSTVYGWAKDFVEWPGSEKYLGPKLRDLAVRILGVKVVVT